VTDGCRHGPLVAPLLWLGVRRTTSERIDRFIGGLTFCFFPVAPVFWLIGHFVGGGRLLLVIWLTMLAWFIRISWRLAKIPDPNPPDRSQCDEVSNRAPRYVPLVSGLVGVAGAISVAVFWPAPNSAGIYWIRNAICGVLAWYGIWQFKAMIFATDEQIWRAATGNAEVWNETAMTAPSAFKIKDIRFIFAGFVVLAVAAVVLNSVIHFLPF
jgi:hypothetical protein